MKKILLLVAVMTIVAIAGAAMAANSNTLTVSASVLGSCKFEAAASTVNFAAALDPTVGTDQNASGTTTFWCTKGSGAPIITADNGSNWNGTKRQMHDTVSGDLIPYTLTLTPDANPNLGPSSPRTLTIGVAVLGTDYTANSAGNYADTVRLSINP